jgi:predicted AAA+ superfamily ATPase
VLEDRLDRLLGAAESILQRLERLLPAPCVEPDWESAIAFRWRGMTHPPRLQAVKHPHAICLADIRHVDFQKEEIDRNTRQFVQGLPANNVLLWGSRGTGKSSLIKALLNEYSVEGLRLIEIDKHQLLELPDILELLQPRPEKFILFCDDLSFEADERSYKTLKAALDGSLSVMTSNVLIYATSNRRHLLPEFNDENQQARLRDGEIHHGEAVEEKISLSERFGLWLSFYPFSQEEYLDIVRHWLEQLGSPPVAWETARTEALRFALKRGSRSGRVARQFALDWCGKARLDRTG